MNIDWFIDLWEDQMTAYDTNLVDIPMTDELQGDLWHEEGMMKEIDDGL